MRGQPEVVSEWGTALLYMYLAEDLLGLARGERAPHSGFRCYPDNDSKKLLFVQDSSALQWRRV